MTAKTPDGAEVYRQERIYMPQAGDSLGQYMVLGPDKKAGLLRDTSIQPFAPKEETLEIPLPAGATQVLLEVKLRYEPRPGHFYPLHHVTRQLRLEAP